MVSLLGHWTRHGHREVAGLTPYVPLSCDDSEQIVHTHVPL